VKYTAETVKCETVEDIKTATDLSGKQRTTTETLNT